MKRPKGRPKGKPKEPRRTIHQLEDNVRAKGNKVPRKGSRLSLAKSPKDLALPYDEICEFDFCFLNWLKAFIVSNGFPPNLKELVDQFGFYTNQQAKDFLIKLEKFGFLTYYPDLDRGICVFDIPTYGELGDIRIKMWLLEAVDLIKSKCDIKDKEIARFLKKTDLFAY